MIEIKTNHWSKEPKKEITLSFRCQLSKNEFYLGNELKKYLGVGTNTQFSLDFLNDILSRASIKDLENILKNPDKEILEDITFHGRNPITDDGLKFKVKVKFFDKCSSQLPDNVILNITPLEVNEGDGLPFEKTNKAMIVLDSNFEIINGNPQFFKALRYYNMSINIKGKRFADFIETESLAEWKKFKKKAVSGSIKLLHSIDANMIKCMRWYVHFGNNNTYIVAE